MSAKSVLVSKVTTCLCPVVVVTTSSDLVRGETNEVHTRRPVDSYPLPFRL